MRPAAGAPRPGHRGSRWALAQIPRDRPPGRSAWAAYAFAALILIAAYPLLSVAGRRVDYVIVSLSAIPALVVGGLRIRTASRRPWWLLLSSVIVVSAADILRLLPDDQLLDLARLLDAGGNVLALAAALALVARQSRQDVGGVIDSTIVALALGGLLWDSLLEPNLLVEYQSGAAQVGLFIVVFALTGVLGALVRLLQVATWSVTALWALIAALSLSLGGNVVLAMTSDPQLQVVASVMFLAAYASLGLFGLDPTAPRLARPGPIPHADALSIGRLAFLGAAVAVIPVVVGLRAFHGAPVDGLLLIVSGALVTTLVMVRIGYLSAGRARAEQTLRFEAAHDSLTGLANRRAFLRRLAGALSSEPTCVVIFFDLNGFKRINDRLGHAAGDELLVEVARRLRACVRANDLVSRFGGDEFLVLFPDSRLSDVEQIRDRMLDAISQPVLLRGEEVTVGASIGVATATVGIGPDELIRRADDAMYSAKRPGPSVT